MPSQLARRRWKENHPTADAEYYQANKTTIINRVKVYSKQNPEKVKIWNRRALLKKRYGITPETYDSMLATQNGVCAICGTLPGSGPRECLNVDHDHLSGKVRALLCQRCNSGIALLGNDFNTYISAANYIQNFSNSASSGLVAG